MVPHTSHSSFSSCFINVLIDLLADNRSKQNFAPYRNLSFHFQLEFSLSDVPEEGHYSRINESISLQCLQTNQGCRTLGRNQPGTDHNAPNLLPLVQHHCFSLPEFEGDMIQIFD